MKRQNRAIYLDILAELQESYTYFTGHRSAAIGTREFEYYDNFCKQTQNRIKIVEQKLKEEQKTC